MSSGDSEDENRQQSQTSLADSQLTSEGPESLTYQDVVESVVAGQATDPSDLDKQDRKNGKVSKQKSRSDPNGDRSRESLDFAPSMDSNQSHSAPMLVKDNDDLAIDDGFQIQVSKSDETLSRPGHDPHDESGGERTSDEDDHIERENETGNESSDLFTPPANTTSIPFSSSPPTPVSQSPTNTLERPQNTQAHHTHLLSVPSSSSSTRKPIARSASSASVLQSQRKHMASGRNGDRDGPRKFSITTDEALSPSRSASHLIPDFFPLGESGVATSMPAVWKDRLSSTESPEREPGFIKVSYYAMNG